jgi:hypothetical protein
MTNQLEDVPMHIADELASAMVFTVLNARALALEDHDRWQQFAALADSLVDSLDTIRVPACPPRCIVIPANDPNLADDAMELNSTLCTNKAELAPPIVIPSQGPRPVPGHSQLTSTLVPLDAEVPPVPPHDVNTFVAIAGPLNWRLLNAMPAIPEREIPKDSSEASHSGSDDEGDGDEGDRDGKLHEKHRQSCEPPDMTEAVPDPYDEAGRPPVGE